jgi:hypothetical protein
MAGLERPHDRKPVRTTAHARVDPDPQHAGDAGRDLTRVGGPGFQLGVRRTEVVAHTFPRPSQPYAPTSAFEQAPADLRLQTADDLADTGPVDAEPIGGAAEVKLLGLAAALLAVDALGWRAVAAMFDRERLITGART